MFARNGITTVLECDEILETLRAELRNLQAFPNDLEAQKEKKDALNEVEEIEVLRAKLLKEGDEEDEKVFWGLWQEYWDGVEIREEMDLLDDDEPVFQGTDCGEEDEDGSEWFDDPAEWWFDDPEPLGSLDPFKEDVDLHH